MGNFVSELLRLSELLARRVDDPNGSIRYLAAKLADMWTRRLVKANHTVMELICASYLIGRGFEVDVEHELGDSLVCDIRASRDGETFIVEIETGFVPPEASFDPLAYRVSRVVSKIARYSRYSDHFALATPPYHILQIPGFFAKPVSERSPEELRKLKELCDRYYRRPPIPEEHILQGKVDVVYVIDVDGLTVTPLSLSDYHSSFVRRELDFLSSTSRLLS
ncbi:MAG: hypothetical protein DRJ56_03570 [Thermoprotei archaeon]|nr:MAG: hypothetical protein DRJ56_03570 [Thermoprotei archaeon]